MVEKLDCASSLRNVVEFGCGYGTFTLPAAKRVQGSVFALDIDPQMLTLTEIRARQASVTRVRAEQRDFLAAGTGRPDVSVDYAMLFNILHVEEPVALLREAHRILVPGGKVGIIHWRSDIQTPRGPSPDIRPTPEQCRAWGEEAGLEFVRYEALKCCPWHWGMVMRRPEKILCGNVV